jgi:hypothetical protein
MAGVLPLVIDVDFLAIEVVFEGNRSFAVGLYHDRMIS